MRIETYPNGGGEVLHMWNDELRHMSDADQVRNFLVKKKRNMRLASVAGAVIQAGWRPEFEDGWRRGVLQEDYCGVRTKPLVK